MCVRETERERERKREKEDRLAMEWDKGTEDKVRHKNSTLKFPKPLVINMKKERIKKRESELGKERVNKVKMFTYNCFNRFRREK